MKMELIEGSETSAISFVTPGNYPKENILHMTTNITLLVVRRRWCHCSFVRNNDHVIKEPRHVFSHVYLECHFSTGQAMRYFAQQVNILAETCVTLN